MQQQLKRQSLGEAESVPVTPDILDKSRNKAKSMPPSAKQKAEAAKEDELAIAIELD